jgi:hypothetical protein
MSSSRVAGYGHSFAVKLQRTPEQAPQGASAPSSDWKTVEALRSLPTKFPTSAIKQDSLDRPIGFLQRKIELESKGGSTKNIDQSYKDSMKDLYKETSSAQSKASNETDRNRLSNWNDTIIGTNKDTPYMNKR